MSNLLEKAINTDDGEAIAKIIKQALGIDSDDVVNYCFPTSWPADREQRASIIGEWLQTEARFLAWLNFLQGICVDQARWPRAMTKPTIRTRPTTGTFTKSRRGAKTACISPGCFGPAAAWEKPTAPSTTSRESGHAPDYRSGSERALSRSGRRRSEPPVRIAANIAKLSELLTSYRP